jgi:hypothetical protein
MTIKFFKKPKKLFANTQLFPRPKSLGVYFKIRSLFCCWTDRQKKRYVLETLNEGNGNKFRSEYSKFLQENANSVNTSKVLTQKFIEEPLRNGKPLHETNKPHPHEARRRNAAAKFISRVIRKARLKEYSLQTSTADEDADGTRSYYWDGDLKVTARRDELTNQHVISVVDVDYYMDIPGLLARTDNPILLYTFQPETTGADRKEYSYSLDQDGTFTYNISGSRSFQHQVWNYVGDTISVVGRLKPDHDLDNLLGLKRAPRNTKDRDVFKTYRITKKRVGHDRQLILLQPITAFADWTAILASSIVKHTELLRVKPDWSSYNGAHTVSLRFQRDGRHYISTSQAGWATSVVLPEEQELRVRLDASRKNGLYIAALKKIVKEHQPSWATADHAAGAALLKLKYNDYAALLEHLSEHLSKPTCRLDTPADALDAHVKHYAPFTSKYLSDSETTKPTLTSFMNPIVDRALAPVRDESAEKQITDTRIFNVVIDDPSWLGTMEEEFFERLCPGDQRLEPVSIEEVYKRQDSPAQRMILDRAQQTGLAGQNVVQSFIKAEAGSELKAGRNISTIEPSFKLHYSQYMYALADLLKTQKWYAFGKTPKDISHRVAEIAASAKSHVNATDFSRCDGTISSYLRRFELRMLEWMFTAESIAELRELHRGQYDVMAFGKFGTQYETYYSRLSGSPETSSLNSIMNAFVAFCTLRRTQVTRGGPFIQADEAWERLGIYGGDDGLSVDMDPDLYHNTAGAFGMRLTADIIPRGGSGVTFLSRMFGPNVWLGDPSSHADLFRALSKFHATANDTGLREPLKCLIQKSHAYYLTDKNTPILGEFVCKVRALSDPEFVWDKRLCSWFSWFPSEDQFPQLDDADDQNEAPVEWMLESLEKLREYGFNFEKFQTWLESCTTLEQLLNVPILCDIQAVNTYDVIKDADAYMVDGELIQKESSEPTKPVKRVHWADQQPAKEGNDSTKPVAKKSKKKKKNKRNKQQNSEKEGEGELSQVPKGA